MVDQILWERVGYKKNDANLYSTHSTLTAVSLISGGLDMRSGGTGAIEVAKQPRPCVSARESLKRIVELFNGCSRCSCAFSIAQIPALTSANTTGSYNNSGNTYAKVFDNNPNTYFDAPASNGNWIQLDLGSAKSIAKIIYAPRAGFESRMVGGIFEVSNDMAFITGVVPLSTISATPIDGLVNSLLVNVSGTYRYIRYVAPAGSYGNIAELQVFGSGAASNADTQPPTMPGGLMTAVTSTSISLNWTASTDNVGVNHYNVLRNNQLIASPTLPSYTDPGLAAGANYSYIIQAVDAAGNVSPGATLSVSTAAATIVQLTGITSANTTSSYNNSPNTYAKVFDNNSNTFFDAPNASGNWVQIDLGSARTLTAIKYAPRVGFEYRMVGGYFQASNDPAFAAGVVKLGAVSAMPVDGLLNSIQGSAGKYRYVRYVAPVGSYWNIAELQVFGY